jgi:hypothetical protein
MVYTIYGVIVIVAAVCILGLRRWAEDDCTKLGPAEDSEYWYLGF